MRDLVIRTLKAAGLTISRAKPPASLMRPVGDLESFLEDVRARGFTPTHIIDVGANRGDWSRVAHDVWPGAEFTLIEPQAEMRPHLDAFVEQASARWIQAGAGDTTGESILTINPDPVSSTFALSTAEAATAGLSERRVVPIVTLDSLLPDMNGSVPELVKIDAEELEVEVLRGAEEYFGSTELFIVEVSLFKWHASTATIVDLVAFMHERGYVPYDFCGFLR